MRYLFCALLLTACSGSSESGDGGASADGGSTTDAPEMMAGDGAAATDTGASSDPLAPLRKACVDEINRLRATETHKPLALWTSPAIDKCVDDQAAYDEMKMTPHGAWSAKVYPQCNGNGQNECLGYGNTVQGIQKCLQAMWAEKNQPNCTGCGACQKQFNPNCPNCDFYGKMGMMCGHYVNMSADYFSKVACGFGGKWSVQNFAQ